MRGVFTPPTSRSSWIWLFSRLPDAEQGEITELLGRWEQGEAEAVELLAPLVYDQLRAIAEALLRDERPEHTLQPTAVVNEVFLDLLRLRRLAVNDRAHFFAFAAQLTRRVWSIRRAKPKRRSAAWAGRAFPWTRNSCGCPMRARNHWTFRPRSTSWRNTIRRKPAPSNCIISSAAQWRRPRIFYRFPSEQWNVVCAFHSSGCKSVCPRRGLPI